MKRIISALLLMLMIFSFAACKKSDGDDTNQDQSNDLPSNTDTTEEIQIVCNFELDESVSSELYTALLYKLEYPVRIVDDSTALRAAEIVIGDTNRDISKKARLELRRVIKSDESHVSFVIYSDGSSIAMMFEDDEYGLDAAMMADIDFFIESIVPTYGDTALESGVLFSGSSDPIEYQRVLDQKAKDRQWEALFATAGAEVVASTKNYYSMYSDRIISWMADLYDPETGAFYFSNSGRNTEGYLPDIEATFDVLSMIENSGMIDHLGGSYSNLPEWFLVKMARWVKSLQDPNGYYYHPQWGKELTDTKPNRRSRDLSYGNGILFAGNLTPTYDQPGGTKGDYTLNDGTKVDANGNPISENALTSKLSMSAATAVSKVIPTSPTYVADYLKDAASFRAYLYSLDLKNDSYVVGNRLSNQVAEIKQRDKELGGTLIPILEKWLIEFQNPANGMWEWRSETDPTYSPYQGVNGVLKLLTLFNVLGIEYPNPIPASESIIKAIYTDEEDVHSVCDVYNTWYALEDLFKNLKTHSKDMTQTQKVIGEIRNRLRADAPELIDLTATKVALFIKKDTSSSFGRNESSATSQGMRVCVPHTNEGDTNATLINTFGTLNHMFNVFGWDNPRMFGKADYYNFMQMIKDQSPVIKNAEPAPDPLDFEDDSISSVPAALNLEKCTSDGEKIVIEDPTDSDKGNVFKYESTPTGHDVLYIPCQSASLTASCFIFESDVYISTKQEGYFLRFYIDTSYTVGLVIYDGVIHFVDTTTTGSNRFEQDLGFTANLDEWFNIRIEYYSGDKETVRMKLYLNGECVAVSDSFNDEGYGVPRPFYAQAKIEAFTGAEMTMLLDEVLVHKTNSVYKEESDPDGKLTINVDSTDREEIIYDFEDGKALPEGWEKNESAAVNLVDGAENNSLTVSGDKFDISLPANKRTKDARTASFEADITVNSISEGSKIQLYFYDGGIFGTGIIKLWLVPTVVNGETVLTMYEASGGIKGGAIAGTEMKLGTQYRIAIDYYEEKDAALIYVNGSLVGFTSADEAYANRGRTGRASVSVLDGSASITLDNAKCELKLSSFDYAVKPSGDAIIHGFEQGIPEGGSVSGATIIDGVGANKLLSFAGGGKLIIPINRRSPATDTVIFSAKILVPKDAKDGDKIDVSFVSESGDVMIKYSIIVKNGEAEIYEVTAKNTYSTPLTSLVLGTETTLSIEYYKSKKVAQISIDDVCTAVTSITYTEGSGNLPASSVVVESVNAGAAIILDNVVFETYNKFYTHKTASGSNPESNASIITFEPSSTGNIPKYFSTDLRTASAAIRIEEMINGAKASKVLAFESSAGANDKLLFGKTANNSHKVAVFKTQMRLDVQSDTTTYEIYLTNTKGNHGYLMLLSLTADGKIKLYDLTGASSSLVPGRIFGTEKTLDVSGEEWFSLRMEYYPGDHDTVRIKTYINDQLVYVSCGYYGRSSTVYGTQPESLIDRVTISSYGALVGTMYLDDMSLACESVPLRNDTLTYIPKEAEPNLPNDEDTAEIITFESSVTGNIPDPITKELMSTGGALAVREVVRDGKTTKVMAFTTTAGSGDKLFLAKTKKLEGYNALEFSTKIKFEGYETNGMSFYVYLREGSNAITRLVFSIGKDGSMILNDYFNGTYSIKDTTVPSFSAGDWHDFKLTLYSYNGFSRLVIKIDDNEYISKNSGWASLTPQRITSLRIDTSTDSDATMLFDDMSLREVKIDIPAEHEHTYESAWTFDDVYHYHKSTCSDNAECAVAVSGKEEHSFGDGTVCVCGYEKVVIGGGGTLGYFDSLGGFDYEDTAGNHWKWSSKNAAKIIRNTGWTSGDKWNVENVTPSTTTNYFNFLKIADNYIAELGKVAAQDVASQIYFVSQGGSGNLFVYETDICLNACAALLDAEDATYMTIGFTSTSADSNGAICGVVKLTAVKEGNSVIGYKLFDTVLSADTWYNLAVEYSAEAGTATYYVDGEKVGIVRMTNAPTDVGYFAVTVSENADGAVVRFDNTYLGFVAESLAEDDGTAVPEISEAHAVPHEHTYETDWSYDAENHWHKANCSDNTSCETAVADVTPHDFSESDTCSCGYTKPAEPLKKLGYFESFGGYDFTGVTSAYSSFESVGFIKRLNGYMNCENRGASAGKMYFGVFNVGENTGIEIGTNDGKWGSSGGPMIGCYFDDTVADRYVFESDVYFSDCFVTGSNFNALRIAFCGADGTEYTARSINAVAKDGGGYAYDVYGVTVEKETWVNVGVIYSPKEGTVKYYANGTLMITDTVDTTENAMNYVKLGGSEYGGSYVRFDNLYYGKQNAHLTESDEYYTFNDGAIPAGITLENKSGAATLGVSTVITDKALELHTEAGGEDRVWFTVDQLDGANRLVFETKYMVKPGVDGNQVFEYMNGTTVVGFVQITMSANGTVQISDYFSSTKTYSFSTVTINLGSVQWIDLKLETYEDGGLCTDIYVNGTKVATSKNTAWENSKISEVTGMRYRTFSVLVGEVYFDDVKFVKSIEE